MEQFEYFLLYELEEARLSGRPDQELLDDKAKELGLIPSQVYYCLELLGMRDSVNWDFKLWYGITPAFKGQYYPFGLNGWMPDIPGRITGTVSFNTKGLKLAEELKAYPFSGLDFPLATEKYGSLYHVEYTVSAGRVNFTYTLKDKAAAEAFFGVGDASTANEAQQTRLRITPIKGAVKIVAEEGRYDTVALEIEVQDTKGNWLYKDHHSTVSGYGFQAYMPIGFIPEPEEYIDYDPEYVLGDADGDGKVTVMDATTIQKYKAYLIGADKVHMEAADVDKDGYVSVIDATKIQKYLASLIPALG